MKVIKLAEKKTYQRDHVLTKTVLDIIDDVRTKGDQTLIELAEKFDKINISSVAITKEQVEKAYTLVPKETVEHITFAANQIRWFAQQQKECLKPLHVNSQVAGVELGHRLVPMEKVGCYIPSGRYPLPSSALMSVIVAKVAGVNQVSACSPAFHGYDTVHPAVLVAMDIAGADNMYCMGGAQAIAAYTYGTETVNKVDMIVGPGNKFVTEAKRQVLGDVGIDSLAGPSEVLIIADETANPTFLAIDLLGQAEHDPNAKPILVCTDQGVIDQTLKEVDRLMETLTTKEVAQQSWTDNGEVYLADSMDEAIALSNEMAPEHLEVQTKEEREVASRLHHYGSLFVGHYAPVSFGDFVSGTNHILPTMSTARYSNGVCVSTFMKTPFHQYVTKEGCMNLAESCIHFADVEGLQAHGDAVRLRVAAK